MGLEKRDDDVSKFVQQFGEPAWDALYESIRHETEDWKQHFDEFYVAEHEKHDMINQSFSGYFSKGEIEYAFEMHDGNWNGTEFTYEAGRERRSVKIPDSDRFALVPKSDRINGESRSFVLKCFSRMVASKEFIELQGKIAYDRHFAPCSKTTDYWRKKADAKGLAFGSRGEQEKLLAEASGKKGKE